MSAAARQPGTPLLPTPNPCRWPKARRHRRQRQRLDGRGAWVHCYAHCHGRRTHRPPLILRERGALQHLHTTHAMHVHAYHHLLTLTTATMTDRTPRQPWVHGSPDAHELAYHVPQVYRSIHGRSCRRCRALPRRLPRWPAGLQQPPHLAARARHRRQRRWRISQYGACPWSTLGGIRGPRGGRVAVSHANLGRARSGARKAPSGSEAGPGGLGPTWRCPTVPL